MSDVVVVRPVTADRALADTCPPLTMGALRELLAIVPPFELAGFFVESTLDRFAARFGYNADWWCTGVAAGLLCFMRVAPTSGRPVQMLACLNERRAQMPPGWEAEVRGDTDCPVEFVFRGEFAADDGPEVRA